MMMMTSLRIAKAQDGILACEVGEKTQIRPTRRDLQRSLGEKYTRQSRFREYGEIGWES